MQEQIELQRLEAYKRQIVEEERQRLLQEHATKLLGYLPKVSFVRLLNAFGNATFTSYICNRLMNLIYDCNLYASYVLMSP